MNYKWRYLAANLLIAVVMALSSCKEQSTEARVLYFNIDSLVSVQVRLLATHHATLAKEAVLNNKVVTSVFHAADTILWTTELDEFRELDAINKASSRGAYAVQKELPDSKSNLTVKSFVSTKPLSVEYFKLYYQDYPSKLKKIEAFYHKQNYLYQSSRKLHMEFQEVHHIVTLTSYSITGGQKMFLGDSLKFAITGKITFNK